jgi:hypothetical protein
MFLVASEMHSIARGIGRTRSSVSRYEDVLEHRERLFQCANTAHFRHVSPAAKEGDSKNLMECADRPYILSTRNM